MKKPSQINHLGALRPINGIMLNEASADDMLYHHAEQNVNKAGTAFPRQCKINASAKVTRADYSAKITVCQALFLVKMEKIFNLFG